MASFKLNQPPILQCVPERTRFKASYFLLWLYTFAKSQGERPWLRGWNKNTRLGEKAIAYCDTSSAYCLYRMQDGRAYVCMAVGCDVDFCISFKWSNWTCFKMSFCLSLMKFGTNGTHQVKRLRHKQAKSHRVYSSWSLLGSVTKNLTLKLRLWGEPPGEREHDKSSNTNQFKFDV